MQPVLDLDRQNDVCSILAVGGTMKMAATYVGCTERTLYNTANRDPEFQKRLRRSRLSPELLCLRTINKASHTGENWRAALHLVKHLYPERYARKADTVPVAHVKEVIDNLVRGIDSAVTDERTRIRIGRRVHQAIGMLRPGKAAKRRKRRTFLKG